jgi:putative membrane protein
MHDLEPFRWSTVLHHWSVAPVPIVLLALALLGYVVAARSQSAWPRGRTAAMAAGVLVTFLATQSVVGTYDMSLFGDHMVQHLMLIMVAAPLFAFAAPLELLRPYGSVDRWCTSLAGRIVLHPLVAFGAYAVFIPLTHLTNLFNLMLEHMWIHHTEQIAFVLVGYLFFRQAVGIERDCQLHPGLGVLYVMAAVPVDTITGLALAMSSHNTFAAYANSPRIYMGTLWGPSILADLHLGGAIMWIGGDGLMLLWVAPLVARWVREETRRTAIIDAELDQLGL